MLADGSDVETVVDGGADSDGTAAAAADVSGAHACVAVCVSA